MSIVNALKQNNKAASKQIRIYISCMHCYISWHIIHISVTQCRCTYPKFEETLKINYQFEIFAQILWCLTPNMVKLQLDVCRSMHADPQVDA